MNEWTQKSIELANQRNYLDLLYKVYPMSQNLRRELSKSVENSIYKAIENRNSEELLSVLLKQEIFPIKDSYVAYLKRDKGAIKRNPQTVNRITGMLYEMGFEEIVEKCTQPKETNRQIGPLFKKWIERGCLGCKITDNPNEFLKSSENIVFNGSDEAMKRFAKDHLGYNRDKGLDFIAKFNDVFVIGEAKFLTDFGGHQNAQFNDAIETMTTELSKTKYKIIKIAILDGVLYIDGQSKMRKLTEQYSKDGGIVISAVLLRDFLYSL